MYNIKVDDSQWKMTPFVNNYQGLIMALRNNGLVENEDFYVWNYDWRRPVEEIVESLNSFIDRNISQNEKVVILGHSLGGLTGRIWAQSHLNDNRLEKVVSMGGPQLGAIDAYEVWNGGSFPERDLVSNTALNLLLGLQNHQKLTRLKTIRSYAPVLKDLLPTFDFARKDGRIMATNNLKFKNNYLLSTNSVLVSWENKLTSVIGEGVPTHEFVNLGNQSWLNRILGAWPDGEPLDYVYGAGDGTVLKKSANYGEDNMEIQSKHGEIVNNSLAEVLSSIGLNGGYFTGDSEDLTGRMVFFVGSPVQMKVDCGLGDVQTADSMGFVVVDPQDHECRVNIDAIGDGGTYHLVLGKIGNEDSWQYAENEVSAGGGDVLVVDGKTGELVPVKNDGYWYELINREIKLLSEKYPKNFYLKAMKESAVRKNIMSLIANVFDFRRTSGEIEASGRIIDEARHILIGKYTKKDYWWTKESWKMVEYGEKTLRKFYENYYRTGWFVSGLRNDNYIRMEEYFGQGDRARKEGINAEVYADSIILSHLETRFW